MKIWILFNEYREVIAVVNDEVKAKKLEKDYNDMAAASVFFLEETELE